jgi:hypothetical protein
MTMSVEPEHNVVYFERGRYGGWPANHGIWSWGNEILVGFTRGYHKERPGHTIDPDRPRQSIFARTLDGGMSWSIEETALMLPGESSKVVNLPHGLDFSDPDMALTLRAGNQHTGPSYFFFSDDRGASWNGPYLLPDMGTPGIAARTDYIVDGKDVLTAFLTAAKGNGMEGRPFCTRTEDGGITWKKVSWIGPEPRGFAIMPSAVRFSPEDIVATVRRKEEVDGVPTGWLECYRSRDNGLTWDRLGDPAVGIGSNPPALIMLGDGRLCLTYGARVNPYRICARLSEDRGETWSDEIVLRDDGANGDIGYCRSVQRPDGRVVTVYYFNDPATGPERYIGSTVWNPDI